MARTMANGESDLDGITCEPSDEPMEELRKLQMQLEVLHAHYRTLLEGIHAPEQFGAKLYSKNMISSILYRDLSTVGLSNSDKITMMLQAIEGTIGLNAKGFDQLLDVLRSDISTAHISKSIEKMLDGKLKSCGKTSGICQSKVHGNGGFHGRSKRICQAPLILEHFTGSEDLPSRRSVRISNPEGDQQHEVFEDNPEVVELNKLLTECTEEEQHYDDVHIDRALSLIRPSGTLKKPCHSRIYTKLFKMAWDGKDQEAMIFVKRLRRNSSVGEDLKVVCMEVVHTVNTERDLKMLLSALAYTDRTGCENKHILKCRLHRRIAGMHYRNGDTEEADEHLVTALQLAKQMSPDIDSVYTFRLKALMLFEEYKETGNEEARKGAERQFQLAMDHSRTQPDWKRLITERIKISKGQFHLDMIEHYRKSGKSEDTIEQLQYRARDTLNDVNESWLTEGDKAFFYTANAMLMVEVGDIDDAEKYALQAFDINKRCGFKSRNETTKEVLRKINSRKLDGLNSELSLPS